MQSKRTVSYEDAYQLYLNGLSLQQVGVKIGVTRQCVYDAFLCRGFAMREKKHRHHQWYDGKKFTLRNSGYLSMTTGKRPLMHRYVYEKEVGPIPEGWDIHHINENKTDNRVENLECLPKAEHTRKYSPHNNQFTKGRKRCNLSAYLAA